MPAPSRHAAPSMAVGRDKDYALEVRAAGGRVQVIERAVSARTFIAADLYGAGEQQRHDLVALSREADVQGWLQQHHSDLPEQYTTYIGFEAEARSLRNDESLFVPGPLQTED